MTHHRCDAKDRHPDRIAVYVQNGPNFAHAILTARFPRCVPPFRKSEGSGKRL